MNAFGKSFWLGLQLLAGLPSQATNFNLDRNGNLCVPNSEGYSFKYTWMLSSLSLWCNDGRALCIRLYNYNGGGNEQSADQFGRYRGERAIRGEVRTWLSEGALDQSVVIPEWFQGASPDWIIPFSQENQDKPLVFFFGDTHGCWQSYSLIRTALEAVLSVHPQNVHVAITGDLADRFGLWDEGEEEAPDRLGSETCMSFLVALRDSLKEADEENSLSLVLGNHDTQTAEDLELFRRRLYEEGILIHTNIPSAFEDDYGLCCGSLSHNILFFPYVTNYANGSHRAGEPDFLSMFRPGARVALDKFYRDGHRTGQPDGIFGGNPLPTTANPEGELNPIARETARLFVMAMENLVARTDPEEALHVVLIAHDHFLRPLVFFELVSCFCPSYRLPRAVLARLRLWEACGHEHFPYMVTLNGYMTSLEGARVEVPCIAVGSSLYGEALGLFALED